MMYARFSVLVGAFLCVSPAHAQILAIPRIDRFQGAEDALRSDAENEGIDSIRGRIQSGSVFAITNEEEAVLFWDQQPTELLTGSRFAFAEEEATLHSELVSVLSGAWRFSVGTTLSVNPTQEDEGEEAGTSAAEEDATDAAAEKAFKTFLAGGGNLSMQAVRPLAMRSGDYNAQFLFLTPRAWVNIPTLGVSENVDNGGAEIGAEFQYHRLRTDDGAPFLMLQLRGGVAFGTSKFHESIGRTSHSAFGYLAPALNFVVQDRVKIGVLGFFGPDSFDDMPRFRVNFEVLGQRDQDEEDDDTQ